MANTMRRKGRDAARLNMHNNNNCDMSSGGGAMSEAEIIKKAYEILHAKEKCEPGHKILRKRPRKPDGDAYFGNDNDECDESDENFGEPSRKRRKIQIFYINL